MNTSNLTIDGIVVVEGKTDTQKLISIFKNIRTIETNGSEVSEKTLNLIKKSSKDNKIILFFDPDGPGKLIRQKVQSVLTSWYDANILKSDMTLNSKKIGIAEANEKAIINALSKNLKYCQYNKQSITWDDFISVMPNSQTIRTSVCKQLNIDYCNNKRLYKYLNMLSITKEQLLLMITNI